MTPSSLAPVSKMHPVLRWASRALSPVFILLMTAPVWAAMPGVFPSVLGAYDFSKDGGVQEKLPRVLEEVSGLAVTPQGRVMAHNDERAVVYEVDPSTGDVVKAFSAGLGGVRGDFEGIAAVEDRLFLVTSSGDLLEMMEGEDGFAMDYRIHQTGLRPLCEFEGLAYDPAARVLLLPCKSTRTKELKDHLVVFAVNLDPIRPYPVPSVFIPFESIQGQEVEGAFHPSGIEIHPETGHRIIISAQEEAVLEISPDGILLGGRELHRKTHAQPEGITFLTDGTLLLADEGQGKRGRLTRYQPRRGDGGGAS